MRKTRFSASLFCLLLLAAVSGCVELCGQRISWFHDADNDELRILLHYDGIHESAEQRHPQGNEQVPQFVENNNVMLFDWFGTIDLAKERQKLAAGTAEELELDWARLLTSIRPEPIGHYREPDGRVGAAQRVTIPKVSAFIEKLNELISRNLLKAVPSEGEQDPMRQTKKRIRRAAEQGHCWVAIDGHAIRVTVPVHPGEWARQKAVGLDGLAHNVVELLGGDKQKQRGFYRGLQALASLPISYLDQGDSLTIVVSTPDRPGTFRATLRDEYEPSLEKVVIDSVNTNLDAELSAALLDDSLQPSAGVADVLKFGPPEEQVRALMSMAGCKGPTGRRKAVARLTKWAEVFNRDCGLPDAPAGGDDADSTLEAWRAWYAQMKRYPLPDDLDAEER